jgi:hypothetical protein
MALEYLVCYHNQINSLNVTNNTVLENLNCGVNQLTSLDVSNNIQLEWLNCGFNKLSSLDLSNNTALKSLYLTQLSDLYKVCVWKLPFPPDGFEFDASGSPNVYFTTDCSE